MKLHIMCALIIFKKQYRNNTSTNKVKRRQIKFLNSWGGGEGGEIDIYPNCPVVSFMGGDNSGAILVSVQKIKVKSCNGMPPDC